MMKTTLFLVVTAVVFAVIGSQAARLHMTKVPHQNQKCKTSASNCTVAVMVETIADTWCYLHCSPYVDYELTEATVDSANKKHTITWNITTKGYEFAQQGGVDVGIVFASGSPFTNCHQVNKQKFQCDNDASQLGVYKYSVNVTGVDSLDPWVVNN